MKTIKRVLPYLIVGLISFLYLSYYAHYMFDVREWDLEQTLTGALRIMEGKIIYKDFFEIFAPGNFFLLALIYKLFGSSYLVINEAIIAVDVVITILFYHISYTIIKRWYAIIPPLFFLSIGFPSWFIFSHYWTTYITILSALIFFLHYLKNQNNHGSVPDIFLFLSGFFAGLTGLFLQSAGVYTIIMFLVVMYFHRHRETGLFHRLIPFSVGIMVPVFVFLSYLFMHHALSAFFYDQTVLFRFYSKTASFMTLPFMSFESIFSPVRLLIVFSFIISSWFLLRKRELSIEEIILFTGSIIFSLNTWHRLILSVVTTTNANSAFALLLPVYLIGKIPEYAKRYLASTETKNGLLNRFKYGIQGFLLIMAGFACFQLYSTVHHINKEAYHFNIDGEDYWTFHKEHAVELINFIDRIKPILGTDKQVFPYPFISASFSALRLVNPTRYDELLNFGKSGSAPESVLKEVVTTLKSKKVRFIITYLWSYRFLLIWSERNGSVFQPTMLDSFIWDNYEPVVHAGLFDLWKLKLLKAGDVLTVTVHSVKNGAAPGSFITGFTVGRHGDITLSHNKKIIVSGMPLYDLKDMLAREYRIPSGGIKITTDGITPISSRLFSITISGAVEKPGRYSLNEGVRLSDAMMLAGGPLTIHGKGTSDYANIIIKRGDKKIDVNFLDYLHTHNESENPVIAKGDTIYIPKIKWQYVNVTIFGAVQAPGRLLLNKGARIMDAIGAAVPVASSDLKNIIMIRGNHTIKVNFLRYIQTRKRADNPLLENNDIIYLTKSNEAARRRKIMKEAQILSKGKARKILHRNGK
ncbi:MAG: SLBB domain-containing protein [Deltaproteobacteria bacterium]|nr:SLBB domain-containing protein [Deltaproteobacteria bacterium]MCL5792774.1 SLBB domain-containing protein [Deltaproteobacteria bacterium]